ncbi:inverse autotransporter beta domain-containing protein [Chlamydia suis]|uniref:inverse autotransporter beta domain-containing protein n=1 Tax=Chlamydia suis TaxID=83559 RepID=UPI002B3F41F9|nr:inverse autotransporter beta domain-containing protein [Chlamydia suis]MEB2683389.1 inverse autotransporter beta domain-containing protein [Chlamydia suis]
MAGRGVNAFFALYFVSIQASLFCCIHLQVRKMCVYRSKQLFLFLFSNPALLSLLGNEKHISVQNFLTSYSQDNPWSGLGSLRFHIFPGDREYPFECTAIHSLFPFYDSLEFLFFSQLGFRHNLYRRDIINLGGGGRFFRKNWMLGADAFCDCDLTGTNTRLGLGLESWTTFCNFP